MNTASISAAPGNNASHHCPAVMNSAPCATMMPHSGAGGRTPRPMKLSPAAFRIAQPRFSDTCTIIGGSALGTMCSASTRQSRLPDSLAACTKPALRRTRTSVRVRRA